MKTRQAALCLVLAVLSTSCAATIDRTIRARWTGNEREPTAVPMEVLRSNHTFVPGIVNGRKSQFLVDTGAGIMVLNSAFARKLALRPVGSVTVSGVGGNESGHYVRVSSIRVADLTLRDVLAITIDLSPIARRIDHEIPLILGRGFFNSAVVELDYPHGRFVCHRREGFRYEGRGRTVLLRAAKSGLKNVQCQIEDLAPAWFQLDTGSGKSVSVFEEYTKRHAILKGRKPRSTRNGGGVGGFATESVATLESFTFGGYRLHSVPANFPTPSAGAFANKRHAGNLGGGILRRFRLWIDFRGNRLHIEPGPELRQAFDRDRLGLATLVRGRALVVVHISPGSPAQKAGIPQGAQLVLIDNRSGPPNRLRQLLHDVAHRPEGTTVRLRDGDGKNYRITLATHYEP